MTRFGEVDNERMPEQTVYTMYAVFAADPDGVSGTAEEVSGVFDAAAGKGVTVRGSYDLTGYRADADLLVWLVTPEVDQLQETYRRFRQTEVGRSLDPVWSAVGVHRTAEFNADHLPAFLGPQEPKRYLCVYPYVRSLEWYVLEPAERADMLAEHGRLAASYKDVLANTVASFGLGDYEWLLAFEADQPHRIVDLMRALRAARARQHTREEIPFFFGLRKPITEIVAGLQ